VKTLIHLLKNRQTHMAAIFRLNGQSICFLGVSFACVTISLRCDLYSIQFINVKQRIKWFQHIHRVVQPLQSIVQLFFSFFFAILGFELRASHLLGRCSNTSTSPAVQHFYQPKRSPYCVAMVLSIPATPALIKH
jgi:hypothetical protein